jgi:N-glycosylase/DNA lyase
MFFFFLKKSKNFMWPPTVKSKIILKSFRDVKMVNLKLHFERARDVALILKENYGKNGIFGYRELPDDAVKELKSADAETLIALVTLTVSLDYMRNAGELWRSSVQTFKDAEVNWVFSPQEVSRKSSEEVLGALLKYGLAKKKEKDLKIWETLSKTIWEKYEGKVTNLFEEYGYRVDEMFLDFLKNRKEEFPSLSGRKIFPHWIRTLKEKFNLPFKGLEKLPIPVDVHVTRATFTTGCITGSYKAKGITETVRKRVIEVWSKGLEGTGILPIEMFRPLWLLSKYGCHYRKDGERPKLSECPVRNFCVEGRVIVTSKKVEIET